MSLEVQTQTGLTFVDQALASHPNGIVWAVGRNIVVQNAQEQSIFTGHTKQVSCVTSSCSGQMLASAQDGCICIWDYASKQANVIPIASVCSFLQFSPDDKFLASVQQQYIYVYSVSGETVGSFMQKNQSLIAVWNTNLQLITSDQNRIIIHDLVFNKATFVYGIQQQFIAIPHTHQLIRTFTCAAVYNGYVYCGTEQGEIAVFNLSTASYRNLLKYFKSKVVNLMVFNQNLIATSDDGDVLSLCGADMSFQIVSEFSVGTRIFSAVENQANLIVLTRSGSLVYFPLVEKQVQIQVVRNVGVAELNKQGNIGLLPCQTGFDSKIQRNLQYQQTDQFAAAVVIDPNQMGVIQAFPSAALVQSCCRGDLLFAGTDTGLLQVWDRQILVSQFQTVGSFWKQVVQALVGWRKRSQNRPRDHAAANIGDDGNRAVVGRGRRGWPGVCAQRGYLRHRHAHNRQLAADHLRALRQAHLDAAAFRLQGWFSYLVRCLACQEAEEPPVWGERAPALAAAELRRQVRAPRVLRRRRRARGGLRRSGADSIAQLAGRLPGEGQVLLGRLRRNRSRGRRALRRGRAAPNHEVRCQRRLRTRRLIARERGQDCRGRLR